MPAVAELGLGFLVRPLLETARAELATYATTLGLDWIEDPSNESLSLDRNYLRNLVLPVMRQRWPAVSTTLARSATHCAEAATAIDQVAGELLLGLGGKHPGTLSIAGLGRIALPLRKAVIRLWLRRRAFALPDTVHLGRILNEVLPARPDADPLVAWSGCEVRRYRDDLFGLRPLPDAPDSRPIPWSDGELELPDPLGALVLEDDDTAMRPGELAVRFGVTEQGCRAGGSDHERPLKKVFQDRGIPAWLRPYIPMVFDGDRLVAIAGVCACRDEDPAGAARSPRVRWSRHPWEGAGFFAD
jgi:tRNA(Ile)-lysidine synthase